MPEPISAEHVKARMALEHAMRERGLTRMEATYHGSGDEGWVDDCQFFVGEAEQPVQMVPSEQFATTDLDFDRAAYAFVDSMIDEAGLSGYENNEGGGGSVVLDLAAACERIDSYYYVEETQEGPTVERPI